MLELTSETLLVRMAPKPGASSFDRGEVAKMLGADIGLDNEKTRQLLDELVEQRVIKLTDDEVNFLHILNPKEVGPQRLLRKFCKKHYGDVSPVIDKKLTKAVLKRNGAAYSLESPEVGLAFEELEREGLVRFFGREEAYFKMLGAE